MINNFIYDKNVDLDDKDVDLNVYEDVDLNVYEHVVIIGYEIVN